MSLRYYHNLTFKYIHNIGFLKSELYLSLETQVLSLLGLSNKKLVKNIYLPNSFLKLSMAHTRAIEFILYN